MTLCSMPLGSNGGYICPGYMCILLYIKLFWCSDIPYIYGPLDEEGLGICAFCYM